MKLRYKRLKENKMKKMPSSRTCYQRKFPQRIPKINRHREPSTATIAARNSTEMPIFSMSARISQPSNTTCRKRMNKSSRATHGKSTQHPYKLLEEILESAEYQMEREASQALSKRVKRRSLSWASRSKSSLIIQSLRPRKRSYRETSRRGSQWPDPHLSAKTT